jgi:thiol-disulfide isomerase/thioredoxin
MKRRTLLVRASLIGPAAWTGTPSVVRAQAAQSTQSGLQAPAASAAPSAATSEDKAPPLPALGSAFALAPVTLFDGSRFEPAQAEGKVLLLYWWASWCPFCALTTPHIEKLWQAQRPRGLQMLGLSIDKRAADATGYLAKRGYTFPTGLVTPEIARAMPKSKGLPVTIVRGRDGRVLMAEGGQLFPEDVEQVARFL